jgi:SAM-dependent methyltransferase
VVEDPDEPSVRHLYLDRLRHASVDLDDPTALPIRYTRLFADVAASLPEGPLDVLHVGGGGFSFPRYLSAVRPGTRNHVLELDGDLVDIARDRLALRTGEALTVRVGDARLALAEGDAGRYDLVVGDAFGGEAAPWHLTTVEVAREVHRSLRPGGVYVLNLIDGGRSRLVRAEAATLAEVFDHVGLVVPLGGVPPDGAVNQVLVASDEPVDGWSPGERDGWLLTGAELDRFVGDARPLTDDHAPVDQLIHR